MRKISIMAFASFLILWGIYFYLKDNRKNPYIDNGHQLSSIDENNGTRSTLLSQTRKRDLDQIGKVINEDNVRLDDEDREEIKIAKKTYDTKEGLKNLQTMLEQSYLDRNSSMKDIKRIQDEIIERKNKLKEEVSNTEKWDPRFVYYLMIQENYTYPEINTIKSLTENGLNPEEIEYINELIREEAFMERILSFKSQGDVGRAVASFQKAKKKKEVDDFIDDPVNEGPSIESKLIEMNYNQEEKEEMIYGNNQ